MATQKLVSFLQSSGLITPGQALEIASEFTPKTLEKHGFFLREDQVSNEYLFLESGFLRAFANHADGNEVTTGFYASGQVVFECSSFFNRTPSQENIQALTPCQGCFITFEQLNALFHSRTEFREFGRSVLVRSLAALKSRMLSMVTKSATQRYEQLVKTNPAIFQHAPLKTIASYLGVTDTSLSRIRVGSKTLSQP
jgi:CRP-like cAMP-binding protein